MNILKNIFLSITVGCLVWFLGVSITHAVEYTRSDSKIDTSISDQTTRKYAQPQSIYVVQISSLDPLMEKNPLTWFKTLYYYSVTRLGFVDIPFTYVIDRDGNLYKGRDGGDNVSPELLADEGAVVIGYLTNSSDVTPQAKETLRNLVSKVSRTYGIPQKSLKVAQMDIIKGGNSATKSNMKVINTTFSQSVMTSLDGVTYSDKENITYKAEILETKHDSSVKAGEKLSVTLKVKNTNDYPWFTSKDYIYVSVKDSKDSKFAINGVWDSFSKPISIEDRTILPGEEFELTFEMQALLLPGKHKETFEILKSPDNIFENSEFTINFEILKGEFDLVQVVNTPILNVRECPSGGCKSITTLDEGQIVVLLENNLAGWYRVRYSDKKEGWVFGQYIREL